jgi:hypothetical protein
MNASWSLSNSTGSLGERSISGDAPFRTTRHHVPFPPSAPIRRHWRLRWGWGSTQGRCWSLDCRFPERGAFCPLDTELSMVGYPACRRCCVRRKARLRDPRRTMGLVNTPVLDQRVSEARVSHGKQRPAASPPSHSLQVGKIALQDLSLARSIVAVGQGMVAVVWLAGPSTPFGAHYSTQLHSIPGSRRCGQGRRFGRTDLVPQQNVGGQELTKYTVRQLG